MAIFDTVASHLREWLVFLVRYPDQIPSAGVAACAWLLLTASLQRGTESAVLLEKKGCSSVHFLRTPQWRELAYFRGGEEMRFGGQSACCCRQGYGGTRRFTLGVGEEAKKVRQGESTERPLEGHERG